jgi:hypothetical protein
VIVISCEGVPFSDAPEWAFPQKDGRLVVITGTVNKHVVQCIIQYTLTCTFEVELQTTVATN